MLRFLLIYSEAFNLTSKNAGINGSHVQDNWLPSIQIPPKEGAENKENPGQYRRAKP